MAKVTLEAKLPSLLNRLEHQVKLIETLRQVRWHPESFSRLVESLRLLP